MKRDAQKGVSFHFITFHFLQINTFLLLLLFIMNQRKMKFNSLLCYFNNNSLKYNTTSSIKIIQYSKVLFTDNIKSHLIGERLINLEFNQNW